MTGAARMKKKGMERERRLLTVKKKTMELSTLCGVKACTICLGPNGEIETWPEQPAEVKAVIESFRQYRNNNREKEIPPLTPPISPLSGEFFSLSTAQPSVSAKKDDQLRKVLSGWSDDWLHGFSKDGLKDFLGLMELKLQAITARIQLLNAQNNFQEDGDGGPEFPLQTFGGDNFELAQGFQQPLQTQTVEPIQFPLQNFEAENFEIAQGFQQPLQTQTVEPIQFPLQNFEAENFEIARGFQQPLQTQTVEPIQFPLQNFGGENFEMANGFQPQFPLQTFGGENFEMAKGFQQPLQTVEPIDYGYSYPDAQTATPMWEAAFGGGEEEVYSYASMLAADVGQLNYCENHVNVSAPWEFSQTFKETDLGFMSSQAVGQFNEAFGVPDVDCLIW